MIDDAAASSWVWSNTLKSAVVGRRELVALRSSAVIAVLTERHLLRIVHAHPDGSHAVTRRRSTSAPSRPGP